MDSIQLDDLLKQLKEWHNINSASRFLVKHICQSNKWPYAEYWIPDTTGTYMIWCGSWSSNEEDFETFAKFSSMHKFAKGIGLVGKIWKDGKLFLSENIQKDSFFLRNEDSVKDRLNAAIGIPIIHQNKIIMVLTFFKDELTESDRTTANLLFSQNEKIGDIFNTLMTRY